MIWNAETRLRGDSMGRLQQLTAPQALASSPTSNPYAVCRNGRLEKTYRNSHNTLVREKGSLSRTFWSGGKIGPGDQNFRNIGLGGPFFLGPPVKIMVLPAPQVNSSCYCLKRLTTTLWWKATISCIAVASVLTCFVIIASLQLYHQT